jgi:hypothetical protein
MFSNESIKPVHIKNRHILARNTRNALRGGEMKINLGYAKMGSSATNFQVAIGTNAVASKNGINTD